MNNLAIAAGILTLMIMSAVGGAVINTMYNKHQYNDYVKIEKTKSGSFYIKDEHIYSISELQTDNQFMGNLSRVK